MKREIVRLHELPGPKLAAFANTWAAFLPIGGDLRILIAALTDRFDPNNKDKLPERVLGLDPP